MSIIILIVMGIILLFGFVVFFGAPYLPTLNKQTTLALDLLDLKPGQTLLELGSGDGRVLRAAAKRGVKSIGYELNPLLVIWSWLVTWRYRELVSINWANYWRVKLPPADGIYSFLLERYMNKLDQKIQQDLTKTTKLVSFAFTIPGKKPVKVQDGLFMYHYKK